MKLFKDNLGMNTVLRVNNSCGSPEVGQYFAGNEEHNVGGYGKK